MLWHTTKSQYAKWLLARNVRGTAWVCWIYPKSCLHVLIPPSTSTEPHWILRQLSKGVLPFGELSWHRLFCSVCFTHRHKRIHRLLIGMACLPCFSWVVVTSHHLAVASQSGAKDQFYCSLYYIILNWNCETQGVSKKIVEDRVTSQNWCLGNLSAFFSFLSRKLCLKSLNKIKPLRAKENWRRYLWTTSYCTWL